MLYLDKPFKHDVFVSYSHGKRRGEERSPLKEWSAQFIEDLRLELRGSPVFEDASIFFDEDTRLGQGVDRTKPVTAQLKGHLKKSAILLTLMTPDYLKSDWCKQEREFWLGHNESDPLEIDGRLFVCRVWPNVTDQAWTLNQEHKAWPDAF